MEQPAKAAPSTVRFTVDLPSDLVDGVDRERERLRLAKGLKLSRSGLIEYVLTAVGVGGRRGPRRAARVR